MAGGYSNVDLSQLAPPEVVKTLSFEAIFAEMVADLQARAEADGQPYTALVESDPAFKVLEVAAYRELLLRQAINDATRAVMLAYATGSDLDQIAANYGVARLLVTPADDTTIPPTSEVLEADADLRTRVTLSLEGYSTAGSEGGYVYHALSASGDVKDVSPTSPAPGLVSVYVLSRQGTGAASPDVISAVEAALNAENVRPMTDQVSVFSATIVQYAISAALTIYAGPDANVVRASAEAAAEDYAAAQHRIGQDITLSGLYAALHQPGVQSVTLISPTATLVVGDGEAAWCTGVTVTASSAFGG